MVMQKILALSLTLTMYTALADNCKTASDGEYKLKATLPTGNTCSSTSSACTKNTPGATVSSCPCGSECCEQVDGTCGKLRSGGASCGADRERDSTKKGVQATTANYDTTCCKPKTCSDRPGACGANRKYDSSKSTTVATAANYDTTCCKAKTACSTHTCGTGYKDKANKATAFCHMDTCSDSTCCDIDCTDCCYSQMVGGKSCPAATHYMVSTSGWTTAATAANFEEKCCVAKKNCDVTCPVGKKSKAAGTKCMGATCLESECCETDTSVCMGVTGQTCAAGKFQDPAKKGVTADATSFKANCCSDKTSCTAFSAWVAPSASIAVLPQVSAGALFFVIGGVLVGS